MMGRLAWIAKYRPMGNVKEAKSLPCGPEGLSILHALGSLAMGWRLNPKNRVRCTAKGSLHLSLCMQHNYCFLTSILLMKMEKGVGSGNVVKPEWTL